MRNARLVAALIALVTLGSAAVAYASSQFVQKSNVTLTATKAKTPTGFKVGISSEDKGAPQPQGLKTLTITFPKRTKFNFHSSAIKQCKATDIELKATGGHACPSKSLIGTGLAVANGAPVLPVIPENAAAYAGNGQILLLLSPKGPAGQVLVIHASIAAEKLVANVPVINQGGLNIVITSLELVVKTLGKASNAFVTAGECTKGKFTVSSHFLYQTGASLTLSSASKCSK